MNCVIFVALQIHFLYELCAPFSLVRDRCPQRLCVLKRPIIRLMLILYTLIAALTQPRCSSSMHTLYTHLGLHCRASPTAHAPGPSLPCITQGLHCRASHKTYTAVHHTRPTLPCITHGTRT